MPNADLIPVRVELPDIPRPKMNLDEVQQNVNALLASYTGRVYTGDEIRDAKKDRAQVVRYLESAEPFFRNIALHYQAEAPQDLHAMLQAAGEVLDLALFGVFLP